MIKSVEEVAKEVVTRWWVHQNDELPAHECMWKCFYPMLVEAFTTFATQQVAHERERCAKELEEWAKGYDYISERNSNEVKYDAPSFASGYKLACRTFAAALRGTP